MILALYNNLCENLKKIELILINITLSPQRDATSAHLKFVSIFLYLLESSFLKRLDL